MPTVTTDTTRFHLPSRRILNPMSTREVNLFIFFCVSLVLKSDKKTVLVLFSNFIISTVSNFYV